MPVFAGLSLLLSVNSDPSAKAFMLRSDSSSCRWQLPSPIIGKYEYNGLHWRTVADGDRASPGGLDQRKVF